MANRSFVLPSFQLEKQVVRLYARVTFGASGAPTLVANRCKGIVSVTRNSTGVYTFVFGTNAANTTAQASLDFYYRLLSVTVLYDETANSGRPRRPPCITSRVTASPPPAPAPSAHLQQHLAGSHRPGIH